MFELVFLTGARAGEVVPVTRSMLAGRSPECQLEVPDPNASRRHTQLVFDGTTVVVSDNGSANGTFVNETRLTGPVVMRHGDVLRLGETRLRIQQKRAGTAGGDVSNSSIFGFRETTDDAEISHSLVLPVDGGPAARAASGAIDLQSRLAAILEVSTALEHIDKLEEVNATILAALFKVFPQAERGFLMKGDQPGQLKPEAVRSRSNEGAAAEGMLVSTSICRKALESRSAVLFSDQNAGEFDQGMSIVSLRIRSAMTVPLIVGKEILGLLQIDTSDPARAFTRIDLELAVAASRMAAIALKNAAQLRKIEVETSHRQNLSRFVPGPVVDQVMAGGIDIGLGGKTYHGTILFSDVIGFTRMSESLAPDQVVRLMNDYFALMVPCIERDNGSVDKFIGDAIMAFWGIPFDKGDSSAAAARAALNMQNALVGLNSRMRAEGRPELHIGVGLNSGPVVAGNIGVGNRMEYTLLGDAVNTASRIEHAAGRGQVMASLQTFSELKGGGHAVAMPPLKAKNKAEPLAVVCLRALAVEQGEVLLHLPLASGVGGAAEATLIRRLADGSFVVLHPRGCDICAAPLVTAAPEWHGVEVGTPVMVAVLPQQQTDGEQVRSQVTLPDVSLAGLLADPTVPCNRGWETR